MSQADGEALDWFVRRADGLAQADEARFQAWLAGHPDRAEAYARWQRDWRALDALPASGVERLKQGLAQERPATARVPAAAMPAWHRFTAWFSLPRTAMAGLALMLACTLAAFLWSQPLTTSVHATAARERLDTTLADGSRLQLGPASRAVATTYRSRREIELPRGLARFEIRRDPGRPLTILAGALRITVIGTRFSVRHGMGPHGDGVRIAVEEGKVKVERQGWLGSSGEAVEVAAGQAVGSSGAGMLEIVSALRAADLAPWHERRVSFDNATLREVLAAFGRYGDTGIVVHDPAVAALRVTGTFDLLRPDRFARLLPRALPVQLAERAGTTEIVRRKKVE